jgi:hypothetical protein
MIMRCKAHPRYKGFLKPKCDCVDCWCIWLGRNGSIDVALEEIEKRSHSIEDDDRVRDLLLVYVNGMNGS